MRKCCLDCLCRRTSRDEKKLENLLDRTVSRLAHLCRQGQTRCTEAEDDVAQHLRRGQRDRAPAHAEKVIRERNRLDGFAMVESYCQLLKERASLIYKHKECPQELREAAAGLAYVALRCGDLPELRKIRRIFRSRFGREFTHAAAELRNNCGVSGELVHKFSTRQPSLEIRVKVMREIANERDIQVDLAETPVETAQTPNLQTRTQQARAALGRLCAACGLREQLEGENLEIMAQNARSATLAASESATYSPAEARTDVELSRSESERIGDHSNNPHKQKPESSRGKEVQNENYESTDSGEEVMRLACKARVPVNKAQSFAEVRETDLKGKMGQLDSKNEDGDKEDELEEVSKMGIRSMVEASREKEDELEEVSEMTITTVEASKEKEDELEEVSELTITAVVEDSKEK